MFKGFISNAYSLIGSILPLTLLLISFTSLYYFYKTNESLKETVKQQSLIISDLRDVHVKLGQLYSQVYYRLNLEGLRASESILRLDHISKDTDVMNIPLPKEVIDILNEQTIGRTGEGSER